MKIGARRPRHLHAPLWGSEKERCCMPILLALVLALFPLLVLAESPSPDSKNVIKGDVLYWEGEELVVKEMSGKETRMHVNGQTKIEGTAGRLKTGDKIQATVTADGHATAIVLQIPDAGPSTPTPR